jgi:hypothetical protein
MPAPTPSNYSGLGSTPGAFTVATEPESYNSSNNFEYKGKHEGKAYNASTKPNLATYLYLPVPAVLCLQVSIAQDNNTAPPPTTRNHSTNALPHNPVKVLTIPLPKHVMALLQDPPAHSIAMPSINGQHASCILIANTGLPTTCCLTSWH